MRILALGRVLSACALVACSEPSRSDEALGAASATPLLRRWAAPSAADNGEACVDVGGVRACYAKGAPPRLIPRPIPPGVAPQAVRCTGAGLARVCRPRRADAAPFVCRDQRCTQAVVRLPDAGEWECAEPSGVQVCRGGGAAAGVVPGSPTSGFLCAARRGRAGERLCVDYSPDRPRGGGRSCRFHYQPGQPARSCEPRAERVAGDACPDGACPLGLACAGGHCVPQALTVECWGDKDCAAGLRCLVARCVRSP